MSTARAATTPLHALLNDVLATTGCGRNARIGAHLIALREHLGEQRYQDETAAYFGTLQPLDQHRLAVGLSLHGNSRTLAA